MNTRQLAQTIRQHPTLIAFLSGVVIVLIHAMTLVNTPAVYGDEPWLGQAGWMLATSGVSTQPAFLLSSGEAGGIAQIVGHLRAQLISFFGYNLFSLRVLSFLGFIGSLFLWYRTVKALSSHWSAISFLWLYFFQLLVFYGSHIGRPEMPIVMIQALAVFLAVAWRSDWPATRRFFIVGLIGTTALFFHLVGALVPVVAAIVGSTRLARSRQEFFRLNLAAAVGSLVMVAIYLALADLEKLAWYLFGDYQAHLRSVDPNMGAGNALSVWIDETVIGKWIAGPIHEGYLIFGGFVVWLLAGAIALHRQSLRQNPLVTFLLGAGLTLLALVTLGHVNPAYWVYLSPWASASLAVAIAATATGHWLWRGAVVLTFFVLAVRLATYIHYAYRDTFTDYQERLTTAIPAGPVVLGTIEHQMFFAGRNPFLAFRDIRWLAAAGQAITPEDYIRRTNVEYVVVDQEAERLFSRPANQPWGEQARLLLGQDADLVAVVVNDYLQSQSGSRRPSPLGGVLGTLRTDFDHLPRVGETRIYRIRRDAEDR